MSSDDSYEECFCGSLEPYDQCHGPRRWTLPPDHPDTRARLDRLQMSADKVNQRLAALAAALFGPRWKDCCLEDFFDEDSECIDVTEYDLAFPATFYWSFIVAEDKSMAQLWEENNIHRNWPHEQDYIFAFERADATIWNIRRIERGVGLGLVEAFTGREVFVLDAHDSSRLKLHQSVLAIVLDCDGLCFFAGMHPLVLDSPASDAAIDRARSLIHHSRRHGQRRRMAEYDWIEAEQDRRHIIKSWRKQGGLPDSRGRR